MHRLLTDYGCDPNIKDFSNEDRLINYCMKNKRFAAAKLLMTVCKEKLIVSNNILLFCIDNESEEKQYWELKEH